MKPLQKLLGMISEVTQVFLFLNICEFIYMAGLTHYFECGIEDLCVPLTMLLDYRGFRLICQVDTMK